ncbi:unnamed protein product [Cylindrotheca closterium]|uniref:Uncharacterized protein n=1 Tax=Cylindrotheca closterium TaxID=2856 RepID=A0AAD2CFX7_9STRA|nr:unnamed protein product [Cylindrotheca closterium]
MPRKRTSIQPVPSSINTPAPLARDVSDLSGSYIFGSKSLEPYKANWRRGHELDTSSVSADSTLLTLRMKRRRVTSTKTPVLLVLMDSRRNLYEIIRLFIDAEIDSAKSVVDLVQESIPDRWKPSCDGIFQKRGVTFTQLINILKLRKYDIQPNEIFIGKPVYMTSRQTMSAANGILEHLENRGFLKVDGDEKSALGMQTAPFIFESQTSNNGATSHTIEKKQTCFYQRPLLAKKSMESQSSDKPFRLDKIAEVLKFECHDAASQEETVLRGNESAISTILSILDCCYITPKVSSPVDYTYCSNGKDGFFAQSYGPIGEKDRRFANTHRY